ncbi:anthrax toxin receptor-like [Lepus europaeus]|uniref:anthrax toxin receptor-like n=1 Tax=Lepus europaeus TaxID=9983 RepID=UPI002B4A009E|nr:anthrax toxin receptor-like [Lepus europaeus]
MMEKYLNPALRMSYITYSTTSRVRMPLTGNRGTFARVMSEMKDNSLSGMESNLQEGLKQAIEQMERANSAAKVLSVIIALVSGPIPKASFEEAKVQAAKARSLGAYIYVVGVMTYEKYQLEAIADSPDHVEVVEGPSKSLHAHVDWFCTRACLELREVDPDPVCAGDDIVNFIGYGFHNAKTEDNIICRFKFSDRDVVEEKAVRLVGRFKIQCPLPKKAKPNQKIIVEVSLNKGRNFLANDVSMTVVHCPVRRTTTVRTTIRTTTTTKPPPPPTPPPTTKPTTIPTTKLTTTTTPPTTTTTPPPPPPQHHNHRASPQPSFGDHHIRPGLGADLSAAVVALVAVLQGAVAVTDIVFPLWLHLTLSLASLWPPAQAGPKNLAWDT